MDSNTGEWLQDSTPEFIGIKHQLSLALNQCSKQVSSKELSIFQLKNKQTTLPSSRSSKLSLPCFLDYSTRQSELREICEGSGFNDLSAGQFMCIRWGGIDFLTNPSVNPLMDTDEELDKHFAKHNSQVLLVLLDAEVGRSQVLMKRQAAAVNTSKHVLLPGFDSQYVVNKEDEEDLSMSNINALKHRYGTSEAWRGAKRRAVRTPLFRKWSHFFFANTLSFLFTAAVQFL